MYAEMTLDDTNVNDNIHACVAPHDAYTCNHFHWAACAFSQVGCRVFIFTHMHLGSSLSLSYHLHGHRCVCSLFTMILPFNFLLYLPPLFLFLNYVKSVVNLHNSCNESMDSTDEFSLSTFCCYQVWKLVGKFHGMLYQSAKSSQISYLMGTRPLKNVLENHIKDRLFHLVHWLSITL